MAPPAGTVKSIQNGPVQTFTPEQLDAIYPGASAIWTHDNIVEGLTELEAAVPHEAAADEPGAYTYTVDGNSLTLPSAAAFEAQSDAPVASGGSGGVTPAFSYCECSGKEIIGFNQKDQIALKNGGAAAVVAALCLIPFVGWAACAVLSVAAAVALTYLINHGICSGGRTLWWWNVNGGSAIQCRATRP